MSYQAVDGGKDGDVPPPPPPANAPSAPPPEDAAAGQQHGQGHGGDARSTETDPLVPSLLSEDHDDFPTEEEKSAEREKYRLRRLTKKLLPWIGLALIVLSVVVAVCIILTTSAGRSRRSKRHQAREYEAVVSNYEKEAKHDLKNELNGPGRTTSSVVSPGCESTVIIMRHCDKTGGHLKDDEGDEHCGYMGYERAQYLAALFGDDDESRWPVPSFLYAMGPSRRGVENHKRTFRQIETLVPLAEKAGVSIHSNYVIGDDAKLAHKIFGELRSGALCGRVAVVSWRHPEIPSLAQHLGCGPSNGCPMTYGDYDFDSVWQIKYVYAPLRPRAGEPGLQTEVVAPPVAPSPPPPDDSSSPRPPDDAGAQSDRQAPQQDQSPPSLPVEQAPDDETADDTQQRYLKKTKKVKKKIKTAAANATDTAATGTAATTGTTDATKVLTKKDKKLAKKAKKKAKAKAAAAKAAAAGGITAAAVAASAAATTHATKKTATAVQHAQAVAAAAAAGRPVVPLIWEVHGSVVTMNFDPLKYSKSVGDYPKDGTPSGGRWIGGS